VLAETWFDVEKFVPRKRKLATTNAARPDGRDADVRIIGGVFRGRRLHYHGDTVVRPMKHRTREAIFNLIGTECGGRHAIDLFAGTGALGLEALSRGAASATFIEKHVPSARIVQENIHTLAVEDRTNLLVTSAFLWGKRDLASAAGTSYAGKTWLVFCSPPYAFFHERVADMLALIARLQSHAPSDSILVVEADENFDFDLLRQLNGVAGDGSWDIRHYAPAAVGIWRN
jgi:16S rRNA (guanine966-N2)-methyltransferase